MDNLLPYRKQVILLAFHLCYTHTHAQLLLAIQKKAELAHLCMFALLKNSNPFQDFLIDELESPRVLLNPDTQPQVKQQQFATEATHEAFRPVPSFSFSSRTASETECCFLFMTRTHRVPTCLQAHFYKCCRMWPRSRGWR